MLCDGGVSAHGNHEKLRAVFANRSPKIRNVKTRAWRKISRRSCDAPPQHGAAYSEQSRAHAGLLMCHGNLSIMHQQPSDIPHNCHDVRSSPTIYTDVLSAERPYRRPRLCSYSSRCRCRLSLLSSLVSTVRRGPGAPVNAIMN